jgi:hypothetical protein
LTNALQLVRTTPRALTQYEAGFHSSAEKYRERASLIRDSMSASIGAEERAQLVAVATDFEELAASLEGMRARQQISGLIGLTRRRRNGGA